MIMNKEELLDELYSRIKSGEISRQDVIRRLADSQEEKSHNFSVTRLLYIIGAAIVVIGIIIFVGQIWDDIGVFGRILVTLILGLIFAGAGSVLMKEKPGNYIGGVFHFIGGVLIPSGAIVTLNELDVNLNTVWPIIGVFFATFLFYLILDRIHKHPVLTFFTIVNGSIFAYHLFAKMTEGLSDSSEIIPYFFIILGASYLLLSDAFKDTWNQRLIGLLYFFGSGMFLLASFSKVIDSPAWQIAYVFIIAGAFLLSVAMRSRIILAISTIFLLAYVSYITGEYFADSLGWPISLVILGFIFIGLGYGSITISNKYIRRNG